MIELNAQTNLTPGVLESVGTSTKRSMESPYTRARHSVSPRPVARARPFTVVLESMRLSTASSVVVSLQFACSMDPGLGTRDPDL